MEHATRLRVSSRIWDARVSPRLSGFLLAFAVGRSMFGGDLLPSVVALVKRAQASWGPSGHRAHRGILGERGKVAPPAPVVFVICYWRWRQVT